MIEIKINAETTHDLFNELKKAIGGDVTESWNEHLLIVNNELAVGSIHFVPFDWGVNLLDFDITFHKEIIFKIDTSEFNPIRFIYILEGFIKHRFGIHKEEKTVNQFHSLIFASVDEGCSYIHFPKNEYLQVNVIQIARKQFLKKRTTNVSTLNKKLHEVFLDTDHEKRFLHYGSINLRMSDLVKDIKNIKEKGMLKVLKTEAKVYEILFMHLQNHNKYLKGVTLPQSLLKNELKIVKQYGNMIVKNPEKNYSLEQLSKDSGLSQVKLQDGFKFLYTRTVTEYIRHTRLEAARNLMNTTDLNISQIVYSIGFTSRSYFSKIFKEKYGLTPNEFKKQLVVKVDGV